MLSNHIQSFNEIINHLCGSRFQLVTSLASSITYRSTLIDAIFTLELSEARIHSYFYKEKQSLESIWESILDVSIAKSNSKLNQELLFWENEQLLFDKEINNSSGRITKIEIASEIFHIEDSTLLRNAISDALDFSEFLINCAAENIYFEEGNLKLVTTKRYERSALLRRLAIQIHGLSCLICGLNFENKYGEIGKNFIHVHHIERLADKGTRSVDPRSDLIPVCPNCHAMLHTKVPPMNPADLQDKLRIAKND